MGSIGVRDLERGWRRRGGLRWLKTVGLIVAMTAAWLSEPSVRAERYLTVDEAQKLAFPDAERFESVLWRFSKAQRNKIAEAAAVQVYNRGNQVRLAYQGGEVKGILVVDQVFGKHELIDYAVALSPTGKVLQVEILEYRESQGREIRNESWRAQFRGKTSDSKLRLNDDIYNISGATVSCQSVTEGVRRILATFEIVGRPLLAASGGQSSGRSGDGP